MMPPMFNCFQNNMLQHTANNLNISTVDFIGISNVNYLLLLVRSMEHRLQKKFRERVREKRAIICYIEIIDVRREKKKACTPSDESAWCALCHFIAYAWIIHIHPVVALLYSIELMCCGYNNEIRCVRVFCRHFGLF